MDRNPRGACALREESNAAGFTALATSHAGALDILSLTECRSETARSSATLFQNYDGLRSPGLPGVVVLAASPWTEGKPEKLWLGGFANVQL